MIIMVLIPIGFANTIYYIYYYYNYQYYILTPMNKTQGIKQTKDYLWEC